MAIAGNNCNGVKCIRTCGFGDSLYQKKWSLLPKLNLQFNIGMYNMAFLLGRGNGGEREGARVNSGANLRGEWGGNNEKATWTGEHGFMVFTFLAHSTKKTASHASYFICEGT